MWEALILNRRFRPYDTPPLALAHRPRSTVAPYDLCSRPLRPPQVRVLLEAGADPNAVSRTGAHQLLPERAETPLILAVGDGVS